MTKIETIKFMMTSKGFKLFKKNIESQNKTLDQWLGENKLTEDELVAILSGKEAFRKEYRLVIQVLMGKQKLNNGD